MSEIHFSGTPFSEGQCHRIAQSTESNADFISGKAGLINLQSARICPDSSKSENFLNTIPSGSETNFSPTNAHAAATR